MVHKAGDLNEDGVQRCVRCGVILSDYRGAMVPTGSPPLTGFPAGAAVEVLTGSPKYSGLRIQAVSLTDDPPDCETLQ